MSAYQIFFRQLAVVLPLGLHEFERKAPQRVLLDIVIELALPDDYSGDPGGFYDYDKVREFILGLGRGEQIVLQESLCQQIIEFCRDERSVTGVAVRSAKPDVYPDVEAVGCCMAWGTVTTADLARRLD